MKTWICPKCGQPVTVEWRKKSDQSDGIERLWMTCKCGYIWEEEPLDAAPRDHVADDSTMTEAEHAQTLRKLRDVARVASAHLNGRADHMAIRYALAAARDKAPPADYRAARGIMKDVFGPEPEAVIRAIRNGDSPIPDTARAIETALP